MVVGAGGPAPGAPGAPAGGLFGPRARGAATGEHGDDVDRLGDEGAGHGDHGFLDQLLQAAERAERRAGVQRPDPAGVAGAPGLQKAQRLRAPDLADGDAVGAKPERGADQVGQADHAVAGAKRH